MIPYLLKKLIKTLEPEFPEIKEDNFIFPGKFGDISCNICFLEGKRTGKSPSEIASETLGKLRLPEEFKRVEEKSGYINFYLNYGKISKELLEEPMKPDKTKKKVMIEFSNPNPCKAMHIGHSRTTLLGDSISRILEWNGNEVIKANYYNDLGKQVAKVIKAIQLYGIKGGKKFDQEMAELYVRLHKELKEKPELESEIQLILTSLEKGDSKIHEIWKRVVSGVTESFEETYQNLGIDFDVYFYESDFREEGKKIVKKLQGKGYAKESEGCIVSDIEKFGIPNTVLLRSDGTGLYLTSDLALTLHKFEEFSLDKNIWVVDAAQSLHFKQLFKLLELLGKKYDCVHMAYGLVTLHGSKMSSRSGEFILLDDLIAEVIEKAEEEVLKREAGIDEKELKERAVKIGLAALKYDILKVERNRNVDFNPDKAISFEGDTGPYLQYMVVRCNSIIEKSKEVSKLKEEIRFEPNDYEKNLLRKFLEFEIVVCKSASQLKPSLLCNYTLELATTFSKFYENCRVIGSDEEEFRLALVFKARELLETSLSLLGIPVPKKM